MGFPIRKQRKFERVRVVAHRVGIIKLRDLGAIREPASAITDVATTPHFGRHRFKCFLDANVIDPTIEVFFPANVDAGVATCEQDERDGNRN
jgi:hypothetical protein